MKELEPHKADELHEAPELNSLEKKPFFEAPEGYFERLPDVLRERLTDEDPLRSARVLASLDKQAFFQTPADYFDRFPEKLMSQLPVEKQEPVVLNLWQQIRKPQHALSVAAVILLFILGVWVMPSNDASQQTGFSSEELLAMVDMSEIDAETLVDILGDESLEAFPYMDNLEISEEDLDVLLMDLEPSDLEETGIW